MSQDGKMKMCSGRRLTRDDRDDHHHGRGHQQARGTTPAVFCYVTLFFGLCFRKFLVTFLQSTSTIKIKEILSHCCRQAVIATDVTVTHFPPHLMDLRPRDCQDLHRFCAAHTGICRHTAVTHHRKVCQLRTEWLICDCDFQRTVDSVFRIVVLCNSKASSDRLSRSYTILMM